MIKTVIKNLTTDLRKLLKALPKRDENDDSSGLFSCADVLFSIDIGIASFSIGIMLLFSDSSDCASAYNSILLNKDFPTPFTFKQSSTSSNGRAEIIFSAMDFVTPGTSVNISSLAVFMKLSKVVIIGTPEDYCKAQNV